MTPEDYRTTKIAELEKRYLAGEAEALLDVVAICLATGAKPPEWAVTAFNAAWAVRYQGNQVRTLGEAFGIERPSNWRQRRAQKDVLTYVIWQRVLHERREHDVPIGQPLFEWVAEALSVENGVKLNSTDVSDAYYAVVNFPKNRRDSR